MSNKGSMAYTLVIIVAALIIGFVLFGFVGDLFAKSPRIVIEQTCRSTNLFRVGTELAIIGKTAPRVCTTIDIKKLPEETFANQYLPPRGKESDQKKYAAMQNIGSLSARCWWMWLEGEIFVGEDGKVKTKDVMDTKSFLKDKQCFICYTFRLDDKVTFTLSELYNHLGTSYYEIKDTSECGGDLGGICKIDCSVPTDNDPNPNFKEEVAGSCSAGRKCCAVSKRHPCENKGGKCGSPGVINGVTYDKPFNGWTCPNQGMCYIAEKNYFSFTRYIQEFKGRGRFLATPSTFTPNEPYAVVFSEETDGKFLSALGLSGKDSDLDAIIIAPLRQITQSCYIDTGIAEVAR